MNDTSQEVLLLNCMNLLKKKLGGEKGRQIDQQFPFVPLVLESREIDFLILNPRLTQSKSTFEVAFILQNTLRRGSCDCEIKMEQDAICIHLLSTLFCQDVFFLKNRFGEILDVMSDPSSFKVCRTTWFLAQRHERTSRASFATPLSRS